MVGVGGDSSAPKAGCWGCSRPLRPSTDRRPKIAALSWPERVGDLTRSVCRGQVKRGVYSALQMTPISRTTLNFVEQAARNTTCRLKRRFHSIMKHLEETPNLSVVAFLPDL